MNIIHEPTAVYIKPVQIVDAIYKGEYLVHMLFTDGHNQTLDFKPFLEQSNHPAIRRFLDLDLFQQFEIREGNIQWKEFDLIFPLADFYQGKL